MTPKQKAKELYLKFSRYTDSEFTEFHHKYTKECALIAVNEILDNDNHFIQTGLQFDYWIKVKEQIKSL